jgi:hypothetical protein
MKLTITNIGVLMVALVAISAGSTYALTQDLVDYDNIMPSGFLMTGNVKVTQYDADGNVVALRQTDNHIVAHGMEIIMQQVFHDINETAPFPVAGSGGRVQFMEIGTGGENNLLYNNSDIAVAIGGCARIDAAIANVSSHKAPDDCKITDPTGASCFARMNVTAMASFSGMQCSGALDIDEAGIFNDLAAGTMFARNTFGGVVLNPPDTLALDWEFTFTDS